MKDLSDYYYIKIMRTCMIKRLPKLENNGADENWFLEERMFLTWFKSINCLESGEAKFASATFCFLCG